ncbi:uncharacterized protein M421DRAFT_3828 [Didymella exigua CBS 183.55]|uniref:Velvet domain-containing protein n=1 Tax=Didymella exigua CBS 183.55 TaxID=1150837 RepID=A0A6A5RRU6_9PLEO|nr:uncharacterized protein M421DRAFT_3828 [Didymella exigua CBS 183.55]KAF1930070.1 hypothetical protein M421DRAFT_3828 [Didymella exigua CBS 183.55]
MSLISYPPNVFCLSVKQQPREALVVAKGKDKARKAIDPPPIVQLDVKQHRDPQKNFLQNPYLFMQVSLYKADRDEPHPGRDILTGTLTSSLHRLKDQTNDEVGLFVFGDISVRILGSFRLHFSMWEFSQVEQRAIFMASCTSENFSVLAPKDFKGMEESTALSRCIADQGVRLRLRKEARTGAGSKRSYPYDSPVNIAQAHVSLSNEFSSSFDGEHSPIKRESTYNSNSQTEAPTHSTIEQSYYAQPPYKRSFPSYPPVGHPPPIAAPYNMMGHSSMVGQHSSLMSPPGILPSNTGAGYNVDHTGLYGSPSFPSSSSSYPGSAAPYPGTGYNSILYPYDSNAPR